VVTASRLDRETTDAYSLSISCRDFGPSESHTSVLPLLVRVSDENDNTPTFERSLYAESIAENNAVRLTIARVLAVDGDGGQNGDVRYQLDDDVSGLLTVDERTGDVTCVISFDHEVIKEIDVMLTATDQGIFNIDEYS